MFRCSLLALSSLVGLLLLSPPADAGRWTCRCQPVYYPCQPIYYYPCQPVYYYPCQPVYYYPCQQGSGSADPNLPDPPPPDPILGAPPELPKPLPKIPEFLDEGRP